MHVHAVQGDLPEGAFQTAPRTKRLGSGVYEQAVRISG
jgi:hypothetical protein